MRFSPIIIPEYIVSHPNSEYLIKIVNLDLNKINDGFWMTNEEKSIYVSNNFLCLPFVDSNGNYIKIQIDEILSELIKSNLLPINGDSNEQY